MVLILLVIVEEKTAIKHDRIVLLSDLISLGQISVHIVLAIEFDLWQDAASQSQ